MAEHSGTTQAPSTEAEVPIRPLLPSVERGPVLGLRPCESCRQQPGVVLARGFLVCGSCALVAWYAGEWDEQWDDLEHFEWED